MSGPSAGPTKGAPVNMVIGSRSCWGMNMSTTVPPATLRNALPDTPFRKRPIKRVSVFFAVAHGISQIKKNTVDVMYIGRRP